MYFKISEKLAIGAEVYRTRYSWGHKAHLYHVRTPELGDEYITGIKVTYYNRTWERFEFESAMYQLVAKALKNRLITKAEADTCDNYIKQYQEPDRFSTVAMMAKMGELLTDNQKDANDWKARILKAGLSGYGLEMPEDWESLSEEEKQTRLDGAIKQLAA